MGTFLEECRMDLGFKGCEKSLRRILEKQLGFEFKKVDNKLKIEQRKMKKPKIKAETKPVVKQNTVKKQNKPQVSVAIQTLNQQVQAMPMIDISTIQRGQGMEVNEIGQVHR